MSFETTKCPVCKDELLVVGLANHIYGKAKNELWNYTLGLKDKKGHFDYYRNNARIKEVKFIKISLKRG